MAEGRRSSRAVKVINYAKLEVGSDEDDDFKTAEAPPSKRTKPSSTKEAPKKPEKKPRDDRKGAASSDSTDQKGKTGRASLDDKLFQRDLEAALRLSQNGQPSTLQAEDCSILHQKTGDLGDTPGVQNDGAMFPDGLELAGEVVVQSEEVGAPPVPHAAEGEEEDYRPDQEGESSASEEDEEDGVSEDDFDGGDDSDDEEFAPTKAKATRSRKQPTAPSKKPAASAPKKEPGSARAAATRKTPAPSVTPQAAAVKSAAPARTQASGTLVRPSSVPSPVTKSTPTAPRHSTTVTKSSSPSAAVTRPLPQRTAPTGGVPMTVPKFSSGQLPASGIRLGLSRRRFGKPLHSVVKVQQ